MTRWYHKMSVKMMAVFILTTLLAAGSSGFFIYVQYQKSELRHVDQQLEKSVRQTINDLKIKDIARYIVDDPDKNTVFVNALHRLTEIKDLHEVTFIYVLEKTSAGEFRLILDHSMLEGDVTPYEIYKGAPPAVGEAWDGKKVVYPERYTDKYGTFKSIFYPIVVEGKTVAIVGADVNVQFIDEMERDVFYILLKAIAVSLVFAIILAVIFSRRITRPLIAAADVAATIAGDFFRESDTDRKDEVSTISKALMGIKETVHRAIQECDDIISRVESGESDAMGDPATFKGQFAELIGGVNRLTAVYSGFLDQLPVGVLTLNMDGEPCYLNAKAKTFVDVESRSDERTAALFSVLPTTRAGKKDSGETVVHTPSKVYNLGYEAIPIANRSGEIKAETKILIDQTQIKNAQQVMLEVASRSNEIADKVALASEELSAQIGQTSAGAEMQQQRVAETATAMDEMNATVLEVAKNASLATEKSSVARDRANDGASLVEQVVAAVNTVNDATKIIQQNMEELGRQAESIGGVMTVITDIADQTNLLALNAAIEAARAGEAGRGFAVVADEVRKLAEKTMTATDEVGRNIQSIQDATKENSHSVSSAVESVDEATKLARQSGSALVEIVSMSDESCDLIASIATAAEEQSATSEEITHAVGDVNRIISETTEGMVQSSAAVHELARMAQELRTALEELSVDQNDT